MSCYTRATIVPFESLIERMKAGARLSCPDSGQKSYRLYAPPGDNTDYLVRAKTVKQALHAGLVDWENCSFLVLTQAGRSFPERS